MVEATADDRGPVIRWLSLVTRCQLHHALRVHMGYLVCHCVWIHGSAHLWLLLLYISTCIATSKHDLDLHVIRDTQYTKYIHVYPR